ncbi:glycosyl hydrolase family 8 [Neobacillus cucumis]|uniref:glycosyl hydrolase family 8 n=1 Tax=Neobacillus cucumis TaxID=1740721 RepID=UPI002E1CBDF8|nr:glycosyl hydrolase family 8 [Neobacillus cucumis]MED4226243.1 glycosyl hydrolase family 8 [Neobacillus cucumis]
MRKIVKKLGIPLLSAATLLAPASAFAANSAAEQNNTSPGVVNNPHGAYLTGVYPNMFAQAGYTKKEINAKINAAWQQLFHGNPGTNPDLYDGQAVYYQLTPDMAYVEDIGNHDVRTEGMGYAMMIAVQLNHQKEFNSLWNFAKTNMQIKSGKTKDFFAWHTKTDGTIIDQGVAPDGDQWIAAALSFAAGRWGNDEGIYNYEKEAKQILNAMWHNADSGGINMFDKTTYLSTFSPPGAINFTDASYSLPAFYKIFASVNPEDKDLWEKAASAGEQLLQNAANPNTGLAPCYSNFDGTPFTPPWDKSADSYGGNFNEDAWRAIANANIDAAWFGVKPWQTQYSNTLENFFESQGMNTYNSRYHIDGTPINTNLVSYEPQVHSPGLVSMNASSAISATNSNKMDFVNQLWNLDIPSGHARYYDGFLYMLGMLYDSGQFQIWWPADRH